MKNEANEANAGDDVRSKLSQSEVMALVQVLEQPAPDFSQLQGLFESRIEKNPNPDYQQIRAEWQDIPFNQTLKDKKKLFELLNYVFPLKIVTTEQSTRLVTTPLTDHYSGTVLYDGHTPDVKSVLICRELMAEMLSFVSEALRLDLSGIDLILEERKSFSSALNVDPEFGVRAAVAFPSYLVHQLLTSLDKVPKAKNDENTDVNIWCGSEFVSAFWQLIFLTAHELYHRWQMEYDTEYSERSRDASRSALLGEADEYYADQGENSANCFGVYVIEQLLEHLRDLVKDTYIEDSDKRLAYYRLIVFADHAVRRIEDVHELPSRPFQID